VVHIFLSFFILEHSKRVSVSNVFLFAGCYRSVLPVVFLIVSASGATAQSHQEGSSIRLPHLGLRPGHYLQLTMDKISLKTPNLNGVFTGV
jgi:hypothetical protein